MIRITLLHEKSVPWIPASSGGREIRSSEDPLEAMDKPYIKN